MAINETMTAGAAEARGKPRFSSDLPQMLIGFVLIAITGFVPSILGNSYWVHTFQLVNIYIAASVFQNFLFVDAGQNSAPTSPPSSSGFTTGRSCWQRSWAWARRPPADCSSPSPRCASSISTSAS
jgi:hypothetical protein